MRIKVTSGSFSRTPELVDELKQLTGDVVVRAEASGHLEGPDLADYLADADAAVLGLDRLDAAVLDVCPNLKAVAKYGVGLDNIDVRSCLDRGIYVGWTPGLNRRSVSELALGSLLMLLRNAYPTSLMLKDGTWRKQGGMELSGKTVGILGVGHIGKDLIELLRPFGCRILVNDIRDQADYYRALSLEPVDWPTMLAESDAISLHTPLTENTRGLLDARAFQSMKSTAVLVNTARGPIVDREALKQALDQGWIAGAALDVYDDVEPPKDRSYLSHPNLICTPHIGGNSREAVRAMGRSAISHLRDWMAGKPQPSLPV